MSDGYLVSLVRGHRHDEEEDLASMPWSNATTEDQACGAQLSEKLIRYLTPQYGDRWLPEAPFHPPPREDAQGVHSPDVSWWRQSVAEASVVDPLTFVGEAESEPLPTVPCGFDCSPPPRRLDLPRGFALKTSTTRPPVAGLQGDVASFWLCSDQFESPADLRLLATSVYVLSRALCPECAGPASSLRQASAEPSSLYAQTTLLSWLSFRLPKEEVNGHLTLVQAFAVVLTFVHRLQEDEFRRHAGAQRDPPPVPFEASFWSLAAALSLQHRLQLKSHQTNGIAQLGSCCCPGLALSSSSLSDPTKKRSSLFSRILDLRVLHHNRTPTSPAHSSKWSKASLANDCSPPMARDPPELPEYAVLLRDCSALMEILQRFCTCLIIGSAWVDEQEPISSTIVGRFLSSAFSVLSAAKVCRRTCSPATGRLQETHKSAALRRMAAATSLYLSFVPCVNSPSGPAVVESETCCAICRPHSSPMQPHTPRENQHRELALRRSHGGTRIDFERKMFNIMTLVDHRLSISPNDLTGIAATLLELLRELVPAPSGASVTSLTTTAGPTHVPDSSYSAATDVSDQQLGYSVPSGRPATVPDRAALRPRHRSFSASAVWRPGQDGT